MKRKKIMFVCTGNTCRSPMAEFILKKTIKDRKIKWWSVQSRGLQAEVNNPMSAFSQTALKEIGISPDKFKPKQLKQKDMDECVLVITMTPSQKMVLEDCGNVLCIKDLAGYSVPDPYGQSLEVYRKTRDALLNACEYVADWIKKYDKEHAENKEDDK